MCLFLLWSQGDHCDVVNVTINIFKVLEAILQGPNVLLGVSTLFLFADERTLNMNTFRMEKPSKI